MAQYATQDGEARAQYMPFGYDAGWLAQQQSHLQFEHSENFTLNQQQRHQQARASNSGILDQNDISLLGDFFSKPDIANQMTFSYNTPVERGGGGGEDEQASFPGGLFDMDTPSGTIDNPGMAFATQHMGQGGQFHMQPYASSSMQQHGMGNQMGGMQMQQETSNTNGDEEQTQANAAQGLVGMSTNRPNPSQHPFGGAQADGSNFDWGAFMNLPSTFMGSPIVGAQETGGAGSQDRTGEQQQQAQTSAGAFGYVPDAMSQYQHHQGYPQSFHMQQQAFTQPRGRPHSMGDIRTAGLNNLSHTDPRSAQPLGNNFNNLRGAPRFPSYGSDSSFGPNGFRAQSGGFESPDHKAANLNQVPMAQEASANGRARQPFAVPPSARTLQSQAHAQGTGSQNFNSRPSTPTFYNTNTNYQSYTAGHQGTSNDTMTSAATYGSFGAQHQGGHGHPPQYFQTLQRNGAFSGKRQAPPDDDQDDENSSASESDASESPPSNSQPARKRRKSKHEQDDEDEYQPPGTGSRPVNSMIRSLPRSSDGEDSKPPKSGTGKGKKRTSSHNVRRKSTHSSSNPTSPATRAPRLSSATPKRPARKRQSGSALPRVNLTDEQRRDNHIKSEKNRRDLIKNNYEEIRNLVPALKGGKSGLSKAEELNEIVEFIENLLAGNLYMLDMLENWDPEGSEQDGKFEYESSDDEGAGAAGGLNMELQAY